MPLYFFHVRDDLDTPDTEGAELPDLAAALVRATEGARALMCETMCHEGRIVLRHTIDIEDRGGELLAQLRFGDAVRIEE